MPISIRRLLNGKGLTYLVGSLLVIYVAHDILTDIFGFGHDAGLGRTKREAEESSQAKLEEDMAQYDDETALSRLARKILNESESYTEVDGKKKPIPTKELNQNYQEAKQKFYAPKPDCVPKPPPGSPPAAEGDAGGDAAAGGDPPAAEDAPATAEEPPAEPPAEKRRRKRSKLPYCEDMKKDEAKSEGGGGDAAAPAAEGEAPAAEGGEPPAEEAAPAEAPAEK